MVASSPKVGPKATHIAKWDKVWRAYRAGADVMGDAELAELVQDLEASVALWLLNAHGPVLYRSGNACFSF